MLRRVGIGLAALPLTLIAILALLWVLALARETDDAVPATTSFVATPLGRVAMTVSGPADGPPILITHGTAAWSGFWRDIAAHLASRGWHVIAVDLPPFGYSEHDPLARYDRTSQAIRLDAVLRASAKRPAVVLGHSFGAGAATELALRSPDRVRRLVLVDAALGTLDPPAGKGGTLFDHRLIAEPITAASITNPPAMGPLLRSLIARKEAAEKWLPLLRQPMRRPGTTAAYARWLPALFAADDGSLSRRSANLAAIRVPVSLIWGEADTVTPIAQGEHLSTLMHAQSFARLPGVGHIPHIEAPAEFSAALDQALAQP